MTTDENQTTTDQNADAAAESPQAPEKSTKPFYANPVLIASVLVALVVLVVALEQSGKLKQSTGAQPSQGSIIPAPISIEPPDLSKGSSDVPNIMNVPIGGPGAEPQGAPGLDQLIAGLEQKVKSDPKNVNKRILLAQTYNELGRRNQALDELKGIRKDYPQNKRASLVLASILSQSDQEAEVDESLKLLTSLNNSIGIQQYLVEMYRGDALIRKQDHAGALKHWKKALEQMPAADNRRPILEKRIADLGKPLNEEDKTKAGPTS